jgi:PKD repeat protein
MAVAALPALAQTPMVFKGGGTGGNVIPLGSGTTWQNRRAQYLYTPSDLTNVQGGLINRIYLRTSSTGTSTYGSLTIRLTQNNMTSFVSGAFVTPLTTVYTAPTTTINHTGGNWFAINLQTPFAYNPTQTLIVDITTLTNTGTGITLFTSPSVGSKRLQGSPASATTGFADGSWNDFGFDLIPPDVGVTALLNPVNNSCASFASPVRAIVRNFSTTTSATNVAVRCDVTGAFTFTLSDTLRRTVPPLGQDTITFAQGINPFTGGQLNFRVYTCNVSDPLRTNDTFTAVRSINGFPNSVQVSPSALFQGTFVAGTIQNPDYVKAGDTLIYHFNPPAGFTNAQYGTSWTALNTSLISDFGTNAQNFVFTAPSASNGTLRFIPANNETDSLYKLSIRVRIGSTGCDTLIERYIYVAPVPVANFSSSLACFGAPVQFRDSSRIVRGTLSYFWDFGDNGNADTSVSVSPQHTYSAAGTYNVTLRVTSNLGYSTQRTITIEVGYIPQATFTANNACDQTDVVFSNGTSIQGQQTSLSYQWDFGDGTASTLTNPTKLYANPGVYTVVLRATSPIGCTSTFTRQASVFPYPKADFDFSGSCQNELIEFSNKSTILFGALGHRWELGNGITSTDKDLIYAFNTPGTYQIKLKAFSDFGCADSVSKQVVISPVPVAAFTSDEVCNGQATTFTNNTTLSGSSSGISSTWDFGNGVTQSNNAGSFTFNYSSPGIYQVTLRALAGNCESSAKQTIEVKPLPVADFSMPAAFCVGSAVRLNNTSSGAKSYSWSFGDSETSMQPSPSKAYVLPGTYQIRLVALHENGCADSITRQVTVNSLPDASFSYTRNAPVNQRQVSFTPPAGNYDRYEWNMGDGNTYNQLAPVHSFLTNGPFKVMLTVTDVNGCENTSEQVIGFNVSARLVDNTNLTAYPNPAHNQLMITGFKGMVQSAFLTNMVGQSIPVKYSISPAGIQADVSDIAPGVYTIHLNTADASYVSSFIKR